MFDSVMRYLPGSDRGVGVDHEGEGAHSRGHVCLELLLRRVPDHGCAGYLHCHPHNTRLHRGTQGKRVPAKNGSKSIKLSFLLIFQYFDLLTVILYEIAFLPGITCSTFDVSPIMGICIVILTKAR